MNPANEISRKAKEQGKSYWDMLPNRRLRLKPEEKTKKKANTDEANAKKE